MTAETAQAPVSRRNEKVGNVVSTKMQKTIVVEVEMRKAHAKYKRIVKSSKKFYAHDEQNSARVGDVVRIRETRPLSKLKRWSLEEIVRRSSLGQIEEPALPGDEAHRGIGAQCRANAIFRFIEANMNAGTDLAKVEYSAVNGMLSTLDPHSILMDPEQARAWTACR